MISDGISTKTTPFIWEEPAKIGGEARVLKPFETPFELSDRFSITD
jgi:hypothetical protein